MLYFRQPFFVPGVLGVVEEPLVEGSHDVACEGEAGADEPEPRPAELFPAKVIEAREKRAHCATFPTVRRCEL